VATHATLASSVTTPRIFPGLKLFGVLLSSLPPGFPCHTLAAQVASPTPAQPVESTLPTQLFEPVLPSNPLPLFSDLLAQVYDSPPPVYAAPALVPSTDTPMPLPLVASMSPSLVALPSLFPAFLVSVFLPPTPSRPS
jgi:hypothetical protein